MIIISTLFGCGQTDKTVKLEKIIFHASSCFGTCPIYHLQLNRDKSFKLYAEEVYKDDAEQFTMNFDTSKTGYFTGQASDTTFNNLTTELKNIGLDTINFSGPMYTDGPEITLIVYYNEKRQFLRSSHPTIKTDKLISILYQICETSKLTRTTEEFIIENENEKVSR